ncbi:MAG TPA: tyrosine-type recombinase/integrase [Ktedonobacteraceae bacterium]|nr:tyrosine-type recombinase/integrase [Ktedonobacteraceae bacterium]
MKKHTKKQQTHLTKEHLRMLQPALAGHRLEAIITVALVTGARRDELLQMKWQDLDLEQCELRIANTKTKHNARVIRLPEEVIEVLVRYQRRQMDAQVQAGSDWQHLDLIFSDDVGGMLRFEEVLNEWYEILARAALPPIPFHELRAARGRALYEQVYASRKRSDGTQGGDPSSDTNSDGL